MYLYMITRLQLVHHVYYVCVCVSYNLNHLFANRHICSLVVRLIAYPVVLLVHVHNRGMHDEAWLAVQYAP